MCRTWSVSATGFVHTFTSRRMLPVLRHFQSKACPARYTTTAVVPSTTPTPQESSALPHIPVLLSEVSSSFPSHIPSFLDCTVGAGGHARHLLVEKSIDRYVALDKDPHALRIAAETLRGFDNVHFVRSDFRFLRAVLDKLNMRSVHSMLLDIGTSSMQLDQAERGFSFTHDGPIDMRMSCRGMSAEDLLHDATEQELATIFWELGEERMSRPIARAIVKERECSVIRSTKQLANIVERIKGWRKKGIHPATKVFQALRIATNDELSALEEALSDAVDVLMPHGRMAVISFHSLEDRIAKRVLKRASERQGGVKLVTKKPVVASKEECELNPRARSAKLRVAEKLNADEMARTKVNKYRDR
ncbi:16S rRNA (cytosine(1402)-N(4))-methyltransferase [Gracilaria domingensis]|nr:16S rRNA (cytosine(1402)-N(4))-methyltransferase [Gracilaria domingensis]KAI0561821.1 16S rRNA (cytosine(1402)-N(4))-methyltransferase [Gracilaria domingensis]